MTAMLSVDTSIKQAKVQGSVATNLEGRANVLKAEVKQGGGNVEAKKEEIAELEQKAQAATSSQISTLADANKTMEEAAKTASKDEKATNTKEKGSDEKVSGADTQKETGQVQKVQMNNQMFPLQRVQQPKPQPQHNKRQPMRQWIFVYRR